MTIAGNVVQTQTTIFKISKELEYILKKLSYRRHKLGTLIKGVYFRIWIL